MEIIQYSNGPEGAKNLSKQNDAGIQTPDNGSYKNSRLIAAISKSLGYDGLHSPVSDVQNGTKYTFDFYHPQDDQLFKLFKGFDEQAVQLYASHPRKPYLIFEGEDLPCEIDICECGCGCVVLVNKSIAVHLYDNPHAFIHEDSNLWEFSAHMDGKWIWKKCTPFLVRELMADCEEDEEFDGDEEDED